MGVSLQQYKGEQEKQSKGIIIQHILHIEQVLKFIEYPSKETSRNNTRSITIVKEVLHTDKYI